jgi:hypothetical protein
MIAYLFNFDIKKDIKKNIRKYQLKLWVKENSSIYKQFFKHWRKTKNLLQPSFCVKLEFNNLYFNYQLYKLLSSSEKIYAKDYKQIQKSWIDDCVNKFWYLNNKYHLEEELTQEEFEIYFDINKNFSTKPL